MGDDGFADPALAAALAQGSHARVLASLAGARVFAAVSATATAEEVGEHGLRAESSAEMAVLLLEVAGARALPVFSSVPALLAWRPEARPVPLSGPDASRAALQEGATALVLDPPDPGWAVVGSELEALAQGYVPVVGSALATRRADVDLTEPAAPVDPVLLDALGQALAGEGLRAARLLHGPDGLVLGVAPRRQLGPAGLAALAERIVARLGAALPPEGLDLAEVAARGPGLTVLRRRWLRPGR